MGQNIHKITFILTIVKTLRYTLYIYQKNIKENIMMKMKKERLKTE